MKTITIELTDSNFESLERLCEEWGVTPLTLLIDGMVEAEREQRLFEQGGQSGE